jgi:hypothetical protein
MPGGIETGDENGYEITQCSAGDLASSDLKACVSIITKGDAVDPESAADELPKTRSLVVARKAGVIVGVGAIKRIRLGYASLIASNSGALFPRETRELGYVAVDEKHRGHKLSHQITNELLKVNGSTPLFATTDSEAMKRTLTKAGFRREGHEWDGKRGRLSLWLKD